MRGRGRASWWLLVAALILGATCFSVVRADAQSGTAPTGTPGTGSMPATPAAAEATVVEQREDGIVRSPDAVPPSVPPTLLRDAFPALQERLSTLPPFIRDTDINVRFRTFYFNRQNDDDTAIEDWAAGGWIQYSSGWLLDTFAMGATYYTSQPIYTPDDRRGSSLLTPDGDAIGTFGEAWGALRYKEYALLRGYRQRIDQGYLNPQDNRMIPNTFEAVTLGGKLDWFRYDVGYVWTIKPRDSNDFISMSEQAGAGGDDEGLVMGAFTLTPIKDLTLYASTFYGRDVFNTAYGKAEYTLPLATEFKIQVGAQYTDQRSVGDERLGSFNTWNVGAGARILFRGLSLGTAMHITSEEASIRSPWGTWPGYLSMIVTDFNRANEKAFGLGLRYDFGGALLPFRVPGLSVYLAYVQGRDREDPVTDSSLPTTHEGDLDIVYNVARVKGLSFRFRNGYVGRGNGETLKDFRLIVNYELNLL